MQVTKRIRQSNYELMRIVSMLLIVLWHIIVHAGILEGTTGALHLLIQFIFIFICVHVNSFVLLTGYFQYDRTPSLKKIIKLFNQTWFYKALIAIVFVVFSLEKLSLIEFVKELLPLNTNGYWFINCYLVLLFLIPYLNILIKNLNQKKHRQFIMLLFCLFSLIALISSNTTTTNHGSTLTNFIMLYFIGAYLSKYPLSKNIHFKYYSPNKRQCIYLFFFLFFGILNFLMFIFADSLMNYSNPLLQEMGRIWGLFQIAFSNPLIIFQSIFFFLYFGTLKIKSKIINSISSLVLGVYLIHENPHVYDFLYHFIGIDNVEKMTSPLLLLQIIALAIIMFILCLVIEWIRKKIFLFVETRTWSIKLRNKAKHYIREI